MWEGRQRQQSVRYRSCVEQHRSHPVGAILGGVRTQLRPSRPPLLRPMDTGICKNVRKRVRSFEKVRNIAGQRRASGSGGVLVRRGFCCFWSRLRRRARYFTHTHAVGIFLWRHNAQTRAGRRQTAGGEGARRVSASRRSPHVSPALSPLSAAGFTAGETPPSLEACPLPHESVPR